MNEWPFQDDRTAINSPVTVVDRGGGGCGPSAPTINLQEFTNFTLRKFWQELQQGWENGSVPFNGPMYYNLTNQVALPPLKGIGTPTQDSAFLLYGSLVCKIGASGAGTLTMTVAWTDPATGSQSVAITQALTAAGENTITPMVISILAGTSVTVTITIAGAFDGATYNATVRCI